MFKVVKYSEMTGRWRKPIKLKFLTLKKTAACNYSQEKGKLNLMRKS